MFRKYMKISKGYKNKSERYELILKDTEIRLECNKKMTKYWSFLDKFLFIPIRSGIQGYQISSKSTSLRNELLEIEWLFQSFPD